MVDVIVVTYGSRWQFLGQVINALELMDEVSQIVLVNNNSEYRIEEKLSGTKVILLNIEKNIGSAGGFKTGLNYLLNHNSSEFVWLLDDDNLPAQNNLIQLIQHYNHISSEHPNGITALMCMRPERTYLTRLAGGEPAKSVFPKKNSFFGFHLFTMHYFLMRKLKTYKKSNQQQPVRVPYAPYGGLFFKTEILKLIGLPDERYFVYGDDFEFTYRISLHKGSIYLLPDVIVNDIENTWIYQNKNRILSSRFLDQDDFRSYLSARNTIHFQFHKFANNKFMFRVNQFIYMSFILLLSLATGKRKQFRRFSAAVKDGINGIFNNSKYFVDEQKQLLND